MFFSNSRSRAAAKLHSRGYHDRRLAFEALEGRRLLSLSAGDLDPTFGDGGYVADSFPGPANDFARDVVAIQPDGGVIVAGTSFTGLFYGDIALVRYEPDGTLDVDFGTEGQVATDFDDGGEAINAMALQSDGKIVVAGSYSPLPRFSDSDFLLVRYNTDGSLDTSFGDNGKVVLDFAGMRDEAWGLGIQDDGRIVVAGVSNQSGTSSDFALARFNPDGSLDDGGFSDSTPGDVFGVAGKVTTDFASSSDFAYDMALQPDGKIVLAGGARVGAAGDDYAVARYHADGSLDTGFGAGGKVTTDTGDRSYDHAFGVAVQADGRIVAAGYARPGGSGTPLGFGLLRYNVDGSLDDGSANDTTPDEFGVGGLATAFFGTSASSPNDVALQADGKIVLAGSVWGASDFALARFGTDGSLDATFDGDGQLTTDLGATSEIAFAVAIQPDGKILAAGRTSQPSTDGDFAVVRYETGGALDSDFGDGGWVTTNFTGTAESYGQAMAIQPDGKIVVAGLVSMPDGGVPGLARYNPDGSLDDSFGDDGRVAGGFNGSIRAVAIQPDGKIVIAGDSWGEGTRDDFAVARFNADGSLDDGGPSDFTPGDTFGSGGWVAADFSDLKDGEPASDYATGLAIQADGKIIVTGYSYTRDTSNDVAAARYNADGTLDSDFGSDGRTINDFGSGIYSVLATDMALQEDGRFVVVGSGYDLDYGQQFFVGRFDADGSADASFGDGGKVVTRVGDSTSWASSLAIQTDGKIVVAGGAQNSDSELVFGVVRYNANGILDGTFGSSGVVTTDFDSSGSYAQGVAVGPDGRIVAVGTSYELGSGTDDLALARYNPDGSLDSYFGEDGLVVTDISDTHDYALDVAVQGDLNIVVAGYSTGWATPSRSRFLVARFIGDPPPVVLGADIGRDLQSVIIQMNDDDLNVASATDVANYVLKASGGDGNNDGDWFNDGDEVVLDITAARYDHVSDQIVLKVNDALFEDLFWLQMDGDDVASDGTAGVTDQTGHHLEGGDFVATFDMTSLTLIGGLVEHVESLGLSTGAESSLVSKLEAVLHLMGADVGQGAGVLALMDAFSRGVEQWYSRGQISLSDRDSLLEQAELIKHGLMLI